MSKARGSAKTVERPPIEEETETEEDPLDSPVENSKSTTIEVNDSVPSHTTTATRTKSKMPAVGKRAGRIKEEEGTLTLEGPAVPAATRAGRNTKSAQTSGTTPIARSTVGKTRGRPKTPATAPTGIVGTSFADEKENTPGLGTASGSTEKASDPEVEDAPMKIRVSRVRKGARNVVKAEEDDEQIPHAPPARRRATRTMRTRTKTS